MPTPSTTPPTARPAPTTLLALAATAALLAGCATPPLPGTPAIPATPAATAEAPASALLAAADIAAEPAPAPVACIDGLAHGTRCLAGRDRAGSLYMVVVPPQWNGTLVLHAHGGPFLGEPTMERVREDLTRWSIFPRAGYAWAAASFRQGGVAVRAAAEDTERLRRIIVRHGIVQPQRTILHGQSWGASVAAKGAEMFTAGKPYDAVLLTSGVLAGGTRAYDFRLDLRVVYQQLCANHPLPTEPQYPLWMGLPEGSALTPAELRRRVDDCLGTGRPAAQRTPEQARRLKTIVDVIRIPEASVAGHLAWGTFHFQDVARRHGWQPVFGNRGARYTGSPDDAALNAAVPRYTANPQAVAAFARDTDLTGRIPVPVLSVHAIHDPTAFVEMQHTFAATMRAAGRADALVQTYTADREHSYLSDATYIALTEALLGWVQRGAKATPAQVAAGCEVARTRFPSTCRFEPAYTPPPLDSRVAVRERP